ncbi:MAG TPA: alpha-glucan family phosphorylase [Polyangia bacterium]|nr:alpha-glucan family phosphorylase [Polyangia bacterium]
MSHEAYAPRALPDGLEDLATLALDLRWTWSHGADHLWRALDPEAWEVTRNPWLLLQEASGEKLEALARDARFRAELDAVRGARAAYLATPPCLDTGAVTRERPVAYFSMEFAVGEAIPLYAGGLGVLAGDHLKTASDLGVPMVAVGLLYQEGYFRQVIDAAGRQEELYPYNDPMSLPIQPERKANGDWLTVALDLPGRQVHLRVWRAQVGRVPLYLLDANASTNDPADRGITSKLYGDGPETRIRQEIVLGVGGVRALDALGIEPGACHLNEGHAAFAVLERARLAMRAHGLSFAEALTATRAANVFTTHTSVQAAFDEFSPALVASCLPEGGAYLRALGLSLGELLALGRAPGAPADGAFRPAHLALRGAGRVNAVSALHADVSRSLFAQLFPRLPLAESPVAHVTNGVHMPSWDSTSADELWTRACGADRWRGGLGEDDERPIAGVGERELWAHRARSRSTLVANVRARLARQRARHGAPAEAVAEAARALDPDVLTLGFARRFAEYKRPNLLLRDQARLRALLGDARRPLQLVIAGKAHPADRVGKDLVEAWTRFAETPEARGRCVVLEDYDLALAQELVQGVDVWLNTPRRPWEACGTSGMKVLVNGGLNLSSLDGWWAEAWEPGVGWAIGAAGPSSDERDAAALVETIEREVVPAFYERDAEGLPRAWLALVRASLSKLTPRFSAVRMMREYVARFYAPGAREGARRLADGAARGRALERWRRSLVDGWPGVRFGKLTAAAAGDGRTVSLEVFLGEVAPGDVAVELYADGTGGGPPERLSMSSCGPLPGTAHGRLYTRALPGARPVEHYTPRVVPASPEALLPLELPLVAWRD